MLINNDYIRFARQQAKQDLLSFCVFTDQYFEVLEHHQKIADALHKVASGEIQKLMISMPPRAGKSRIMQEFIAWMFGTMPNIDILYTGHSLNLLQGFSRNIRNRIQSEAYQSIFDTRIADDNSAVNNWKVQNGGEFAIYGVGGGITGKGGNILIIDDPYATRQDAESSTIRRTVSDWYWSTFLSRRHTDKASQIIIMQRWREDDLIGEILEQEGNEWVELKIPALDENGESFWKERFDRTFFEKIREQTPLFFLSQYQQEPAPAGGGDFKKEYFQRMSLHEVADRIERMNIATFLDPAISEKQEADNTAIVTVGIDTTSNIRYILEVKAFKGSPDRVIDELFSTVRHWNTQGQSYKAGVEIVQYQKMLALAIRQKMVQDDFYFLLEEVLPRGEKEARIRTTLQPLYASGQILHISADGIAEYEEELLKFPKGKHDDRIDAAASAVSILQTQNTVTQGSQVFAPSDYGINPESLWQH